mgnify:CR=1 FL=1
MAGIDGQRRLLVTLDRGVTETLPLAYTAAGHVDHAYAGTVHKAQGSTVVTAHVLGTALARESGYVALSRGRADNRLYLVQGEGHLDVELDLPAPRQRQAYEQAAETLGSSQAKLLALDTAVWGQAAEVLHAELDSTARLLRSRPPADVARLPMLRAETARLAGQVDAAQTRLGDLQESLSSLRRRSPQQPALQARVEVQTGALDRLQQRLAEAQATVAAAELGTSPAHTWTAEHAPALGRAVAAGCELSWRSRAADRAAVALDPAPDAPDIAPATVAQLTAQPPETAQPAPVRRLSREQSDHLAPGARSRRTTGGSSQADTAKRRT